MITAKISDDFSDEQKARIAISLDLANQALLDPVFQSLWMKETPTLNNKTSQADILGDLQEGVSVTLYMYTPWWRWSKAISSESNDGVYYNSYRFDYLSKFDLASNLLHESSHQLGFTHDGNYDTAENEKTVPYTLNRVFMAWAEATGLIKDPLDER